MTDEQRKLVEDNHNYIFYFLNKYGLSIDEWYDMAAIGLCKAARSYNQYQSKFVTYAHQCMFTTVFSEKRKEKSSKAVPRHMMTSLQDLAYTNTAGKQIKYEDCIPSDANLEEIALSQVAVAEVMDKLSDRERTILQMTIDGYSQEQIAQRIGISQSHSSRIIRGIRTRLREELEG